MISRIVALIPERIARVQSGATFDSAESASRYPERVSYLAQFLNWLSPLHTISKDDQHILGVLHANGRPGHANEMGDKEGAELEDGGADALEFVPHERETLVPREEALV
jgi:hypothetical protein